jgi:hypothetical protein
MICRECSLPLLTLGTKRPIWASKFVKLFVLVFDLFKFRGFFGRFVSPKPCHNYRGGFFGVKSDKRGDLGVFGTLGF